MKKTGWIFIGVILFIVVVILITYASRYNKINSLEKAAQAQWANVEASYQRRMDLIPNLVKTVKAYADYEQETLEQVTSARAKATSVTIDPANLDPAALQKFQEAQSGLSSALGRLLMVVEKYPDLKANQNFLDLQAQLEGTENRINVERMRYNDAARDYNTFIGNMFQKIFFSGKKEMGYFEADPQASKAPEVQF
jgi:LemA protein